MQVLEAAMLLPVLCTLWVSTSATFPTVTSTFKNTFLQSLRNNQGTLLNNCRQQAQARLSRYQTIQNVFLTNLDIHYNKNSGGFLHSRLQANLRTPETVRNSGKKSGYFYPGAMGQVFREPQFNLDRDQKRWVAGLATRMTTDLSMDQVEKDIVKEFSALEGEMCPSPWKSSIQCDASSKFRTADGSCNNLANPRFGQAFTPLLRFVEPNYEDGVEESTSTSRVNPGEPLPNARDISLNLNEASSPADLNEQNTHILMQWGQFIDHDVNLSPFTLDDNGSFPVCCAEDLVDMKNGEDLTLAEIDNLNDVIRLQRDECISIYVNRDSDPVFSQTRRSCLPLTRSLPVSDSECAFGAREQVNALTAFVDGSMVYGSSKEEFERLRLFKRGLLEASKAGGQLLLPRDEETQCTKPGECFLAGDERVNEQPALASMHTAFLREHNRIAAIIWKKCEHFLSDHDKNDEEEVFQLARKIVGAEIQQVTYSEFLPVLLSSNTIDTLKLRPVGINKIPIRPETYDPNVNPGIRNAFSTAAYRMGHSLIRSFFSMLTADKRYKSIRLGDNFFNPESVIPSTTSKGLEALLFGMLTDKAQSADRKVTVQVRDRLFNTVGPTLDLLAINIQRGREHGLGTYLDYLEFCGLAIPTSFKDLQNHSPATQTILDGLYSSVEDIDVFAGGLSELPQGNGILGPTFQCLIGRQFQALKNGDRFFYETRDFVTGFTDAQLKVLKKRTLSSILCDTLQIEVAQRNAFLTITNVKSRRPVPCGQHPELDLEPFLPKGKFNGKLVY